MPSKTFVLGAGFSADAGFPLVRNLRTDVISWIETERHPSAKPHLTHYLHGYPEGQFYAGLKEIDPSGSMGFEELMIAARDRLSATYLHDPTYTLDRILRDACGRLLWHKQRMLDRSVPTAYQNFASWFHEHHSYGQTNAIISFNWDLLAEKALSDSKAGWLYTTQSPFVPILKPHGSWLLRFSAIAVMAIWLRSDAGGQDIVYPLAPAPVILQPEKTYTSADFLAAILPMAEKRSTQHGPAVP